MIKKLLLTELMFFTITFTQAQQSIQISDFKVEVEYNIQSPENSKIIVENSFYTAKFETRQRVIEKFGPLDFCIRDWILKSNNQDQIDICMDGSALRPLCSNIQLINDDKEIKVIRINYGKSHEFMQEYSFYRDNPFIKIDYLDYPTDWFNTVDIGTPGGIINRNTAETRIYGQENWIRGMLYHDFPYWSIHKDSQKEVYHKQDDSTALSLNYKNHIIMVVGNPNTGCGFGRIMPVWQKEKGGIRILKLLWDLGFETFPASGDQTVDSLNSFTGCIFLFEDGIKQAIVEGKNIVDEYLK